MKKDAFYNKIIDQLPFGYASHKVILDNNGNPRDAEFLDVNKVYKKITGIEAEKVIGKKLTAIFPDIIKEKFDWISFFGNVVKNNSSKETEQYIEHFKGWFRVKAFSTGNNCFVAYFTDITKEKEEQLKNISLDNLPFPAFTIYENKNHIIFNKAFEKFLGLPSSKITTETILGIEGKTQSFDLYKEHLSVNSGAHNVEWNFTNNKGERLHAIVNKTVVTGKDGIPERLFGIITEATYDDLDKKIIKEQKRISKDLKDFSTNLASIPISKNIFRFICHSIEKNTQSSSVSINIFHEATNELEYQYSTLSDRIDKNNLRELNRIFKGIKFKLTPQLKEAIKKDSAIKPSSLTGITFDHNPAPNEKLIEAIFGKKWFSATGLYFEGKLIGTIIISFDKKAYKPGNEELEALAGMCSNAVRRWITETSLLEEEIQYRRLIASMQQGLALHEVILDDNGNVCNYKFLKVNDAYEQLTGLKKENIIGKTIRDVMPSTDNISIDRYGQVALTGKPINYEYYSEKRGKFFEVISYRPGPNQFAVILTDITERKRSEELREKVTIAQRSAEFKQKFLANMSHEIRTPLTGIIGMAEILSKTKLNTKQYDYLNTIRLSTENLKNIINQILDYSKIEAGKTIIKPTVFESNELITNSEKLFESICNKNIKLIINKSPSLPDYLEADNQQVFQIISNLLYNAVKFTNKGKITINFLTDKWIDDKNLYVRIEVVDTGIGIHKESQKLLFKPFSQLYMEGIRQYEGTGLGLSISKELTHVLGGKINVESKPAKGSKFWFTFKAKAAQKTDKPKTRKKTKQDKPETELKVLHVEDNVVNQKVVALIIKSLGCKATYATNGKEAIKLVDKKKFDLILMDIQMPIMDGVTATQKLKKKFSVLPPIIGLSANAFEGDREKYMQLGMDDYLAKPVKAEDILDLLRKFNLK